MSDSPDLTIGHYPAHKQLNELVKIGKAAIWSNSDNLARVILEFEALLAENAELKRVRDVATNSLNTIIATGDKVSMIKTAQRALKEMGITND